MVRGDLSDLCGDIDESTNHWRDPVEAQQSDTDTNIKKKKGSRQRASARIKGTPFFFQFTLKLISMIQAVKSLRE